MATSSKPAYTPSEPRAADVLARTTVYIAGICIVVGVLVLFGWWQHIEPLKRIRPDYTAMNPLTAICFILSGLALIFHRMGLVRVGIMSASAVVLLAAAKLASVAIDVQSVDAILFASQLDVDNPGGPNRMALNTAIAFLLAGAAIFFAFDRRPRSILLSQALSALVALLALTGIIGYALGISVLLAKAPVFPMALHTGLTMFLLANGIVALHPRHGAMMVLRDKGAAGSLARIVLPVAVVMLFGVGMMRDWAQEAGYIDATEGTAIEVLANVLVATVLLTATIAALYQSDRRRVEREKALARSQQVASVGHFLVSASGWLVWSEEALRIHGLTQANAPGRIEEWLACHHADDRARFERCLDTAFDAREDFEYRGRIVCPSGEVRHIKVRGVYEPDLAEGEGRIFGVLADVSELEAARREAEAAARAKTAFLANMSHEIRTPLSGIMGFTELLARADLKPDQKKQVDLIHDSGRALLELLNDILDSSKIEAGRLEIHLEAANIRHLLRQCVELMEVAASSKGVKVHLHVDQGVPRFMMLDGLRVRQVLLNLIGNAIKFTQIGSVSIEVSEAGTEHRKLLIRVRDTGIGIAPERQSVIFREFVQANAEISKRHGGSGLGLSISRRLAELMGGALELESRVDHGTTVTFSLPLVEAHGEAPERVTAKNGKERASFAARILLVEDSEINQKLVADMLALLGHHVEIANNGVEALACIERYQRGEVDYDIVLMDLQMPMMDGISATRIIRSLGGRARSLSIVGLTANAYAEDKEACREAGMNDHLAKPFTIADLDGTIARWARRPELENGGSAERVSAIVTALRPQFVKFCSDVQSQLAKNLRILPRVREDRLATILHETRTAAHKLAGTAANFGSSSLGETAADVDRLLSSAARDMRHRELREVVEVQAKRLVRAVDEAA